VEITVSDFYRFFFKEGGQFGFETYFNEIGCKQVTIDKEWTEGGQNGRKTRKLEMDMPVKGVPFRSSTRHHKTFEIAEISE